MLDETKKDLDRGQLHEIKAGKTGYGLLIENDGYVSADVSEHNRKLVREAAEYREKGEWNIPNPFVLDVVLQKYGVENANHRIYPEDILKREVAKYQKQIDERMALGECYKPDVEVFTINGYKKLSEMEVGDKVLTLCHKDKVIEFEPVLRIIDHDFDGELISIKSSKNYALPEYGFNDLVTPGHKFPVFRMADGDEAPEYACDVEAKDLEGTEGYILVSKPDIYEDDSDSWEKHFADIKDLEFSTEKYSGRVMCIELENHNFYVRCNGKSHWTCNCNHPDHTEIDLGRVSHNIIECHWEGHTLVGKLEFNLTEGFRRHGICSSLGDTCVNLIMNGYKIGISSRGIGSVVQRLGKSFVSDDFEIICWDLVQSPSTKGSYVGDYQQLTQYIESDETNKNKGKINEKIDKIKSILA